jgi:lactoylglutathione lyase
MADIQTPRAVPESFRARALTASFTVNDLGKSLAWYRDIVGFTVDEQYEREGKVVAVTLKAGDIELLINQDDGAKGLDRVKGEGFSLMFTTIQDVDLLAQGIVARGGKLATEPTDMPWGARMFRLQDPNGFKLVFSMDKPQ